MDRVPSRPARDVEARHLALATQPSRQRRVWAARLAASLVIQQPICARHEGLAVDAEATLRGFKDLHKKFLSGIGRLFRGAEHHVRDALYHGAFLFEREDARGNMYLDHRCPKVSCRSGISQHAWRAA